VLDLPLVSLDLEILEAENGAEIIEVGAIKFRGRETLGTFSALVRPTGTLSYRIAQLTGLTASELAAGEPIQEILPRLSAFVGGVPLVGQSIGLDVEHLRRAGLVLANPRLDTFELAVLMRPGLRTHDLQSVARDLGVTGQAPHRALADAVLARDVFLALVERVGKLGLDELSQIVRLAGPLDWPLKLVFAEAQRQRVRELIESRSLADAGAGRGLLPDLRPVEPRQPLEPKDRLEPLDAASLCAALEPAGSIAGALPGFEDRPEQRRMLAEVAEAFNDGEILLVEAGTGTGKSLAYLLPALAFAVANSRRVIVSTNTINLQDQLREKDVPDLLHATGLNARVSVLKGRNNYLCLRRWQTLLGADELSRAERMLLIRTLLWLPTTATGDRAELKLTPPEEEAWGRIAAVAEVCSPARCPYHREGICFVARARRAAESAHLVIVNHSLLLSDVVAGSQILPEYRHLVVDEAHHLEDEATGQLGRHLSQREIGRRLTMLAEPTGPTTAGLIADAAAALRRASARDAPEAATRLATRGEQEVAAIRGGIVRLFGWLTDLLKSSARRGDGGQATLRITRAVRAQPAWSEIDILWGDIGRQVLALQATVGELMVKLEASGPAEDQVALIVGELAAASAFWDEARAHLTRVIAEADPNTVAWLSLGPSEDLGVNAAPLHVGDVLRDRLVDTKETVVFTSATLTSERRFRYIRERLGLLEAREVTVGSPFDYAASTLVYVPTDAPEPGQPGYQRAVERVILDVATALNGRTLVLFTSHSQLRTSYQALRDSLDSRRIILLGQRVDGSSRTRLLENFRGGRPSVLLGTSSFWEGIDVVGEALSCLIIARLPFALPTDPIVEARSEQFDEPFSQYSLPQAILRFRQGFGRLIRSRTDRGVMIVLDGRLRTRSYRWAFLRSLPTCEMRSGPAADAGRVAESWLSGRVGAATGSSTAAPG
jgi:DNA polymerase-3 subunit epsilon/ATP-dependent DNA helicase DinG